MGMTAIRNSNGSTGYINEQQIADLANSNYESEDHRQATFKSLGLTPPDPSKTPLNQQQWTGRAAPLPAPQPAPSTLASAAPSGTPPPAGTLASQVNSLTPQATPSFATAGLKPGATPSPSVSASTLAPQYSAIVKPLVSSTLSDVLSPIAAGVGGLAGIVGANDAQKALVEGGNKAVGTIQAGSDAALGTLKTSSDAAQTSVQGGADKATGTLADLQSKNAAMLQPWQQQGLDATKEIAKPVTPFSFAPPDLANDPGYKFRLEQGMKAIQNRASAGGGDSLSGATLKGLNDYAGESASQEFQNAHARALADWQANQQARLQPAEFLAGQGMQATGEGVNSNTQIGSSLANLQSDVGKQIASIQSNYGTSVAGIQQGTSKAIADLQTQIASAVAAGDIAKANALTQTAAQLAQWAQNKALMDTLKAGQGANTNTNTTTVNVNGSPIVTNPDGSKTVTVPGQPPFTIPPVATIPSPNPTTLPEPAPTGTSTVGVSTPGPGGVPVPIIDATTGQPAPMPSTSVNVTDANGVPIKDATGAATAGAGTLASAAPAAAGATAGLAPVIASALASAPLPAITGASAIAAAAPAIGSVAPAAGTIGEAAAAGTTGTSALASIGSFLTNPITIGIGAAIGGYFAWKATQAHPTADKFVQSYQKPFGQHLTGAVDAFNEARQSGQMTVSQAQDAYGHVKSMTDDFNKQIDSWIAEGGKKATVAKQARAEMTKDFGENFGSLLGSMRTNIDKRQGIVEDPEGQAA